MYSKLCSSRFTFEDKQWVLVLKKISNVNPDILSLINSVVFSHLYNTAVLYDI